MIQICQFQFGDSLKMPANPFAKPKINEPKRKSNGNVAEKWCPDVLSQEAVSLYQTLNSIPTLARNEPNAIEGRSGTKKQTKTSIFHF